MVEVFKWIKGVNQGANGNINELRLYTELYNVIPSTFNYSLDEFSIQTEKIDLQKIRNLFPKAIIKINSAKRLSTNSSVDKIEYTNMTADEMLESSHYIEYQLTILDNEIFYIITSDWITIYYKDLSLDLDSIISNLLKNLPIVSNNLKSTEIQLIVFNNEYYTVTSQIEPTTLNIEENYNDDFIPVYKDIQLFLNMRKSGLIILRGLMGTGKTTLLRHLITNYPKDYILVTNSIAQQLSSPEFMSFMLENKDSVFILEDCEQILKDRSENSFDGAIASILNMSDGLMSDIFNVKFICTFNADIDNIDPAILRKGRCFADYEFKKLEVNKTKSLLNKQGIELDKYEPLTLADIYNYKDTAYGEKIKEKKIGF